MALRFVILAALVVAGSCWSHKFHFKQHNNNQHSNHWGHHEPSSHHSPPEVFQMPPELTNQEPQVYGMFNNFPNAVENSADVCQGKESLHKRFYSNVLNNDENGDGNVTGTEVYFDFYNHYDTNKDGCVTLQEGIDAWERCCQLSAEFATFRLEEIGMNVTAACPQNYTTFQSMPFVLLSVDTFIEDNVQSLIYMCGNSTTTDFNNNCDCVQLADTCRTSDVFSPTTACTNYLATLN